MLRSVELAVVPQASQEPPGTRRPRAWGAIAPSLSLLALKKALNLETTGWSQDSWGFPAAELEAWKFWAGFPAPVALRQSGWQSSHKARILRALHLLREIDIWVETGKLKHAKNNFTEQLGYGESACCLEALYFISWVWGTGVFLLASFLKKKKIPHPKEIETSKCFSLAFQQNRPRF